MQSTYSILILKIILNKIIKNATLQIKQLCLCH